MSRENAINFRLADGTRIGFTASARLRRIDNGLMKDERMDDGILVGEEKKGRTLARVESKDNKVGYVVEIEGGFYGWVYSFEIHPL